MKINVKAKPSSTQQKIVKTGENSYEVWVREPPVKGLANMAIKNVLADYFQVSHSKVRLIKGFGSRNKVFEILLTIFFLFSYAFPIIL